MMDYRPAGLNGFAGLRTRPRPAFTAQKPVIPPCLVCGKKRTRLSPQALCFSCDQDFGPPAPTHHACAPGKLNDDQRLQIYRARQQGMSAYALAKLYHVHPSTIKATVAKLRGEEGGR